jgi:hypothetical protein
LPNPPRRQYWSFTERVLNGFVVVQDGDAEGAATFDPMNEAQVKIALKAARIFRRRVLTEEHKAKLAIIGFKHTVEGQVGSIKGVENEKVTPDPYPGVS